MEYLFDLESGEIVHVPEGYEKAKAGKEALWMRYSGERTSSPAF
jgi:hypothetical protein